MINLKFILFILGLVSLSGVRAQVTDIPDPIFEQYLIDFGIDSDQTINGQVLTSDIDFRTFLQINESPPFYFINDFTGIEDFTSLETFFFVGTNVVELDFGNLDNLVTVEGISNLDLAIIDISECDSLETFIMFNTSLSSIHLPQSSTLESFLSTDGLLQELDLSSYENLVDISVSDNMLQSFNIKNGNNTIIEDFFITGNPDLQCIIVDDADFSTANWTNIDPTTTFVESQEECDALSTDDFSFIEPKIYPNPTTDFFRLETNIEISKIDVFDLNGKIVKSFKSDTNGYDVSELSNGIYIIRLENSLSSITQKLIIE